MNKHLVISALILLLTACSPTPTVISSTSTSNSNSPITIPATPVPQDLIATAPIQSTQVNAPETSGLWLQIRSPLDEAVLNAPQVTVIGSAPAGTVISINDQILIVDSDLQFTTSGALEEGPNVIQIIASDEDGNELSALLTVTYEP